MQLSGNPDTEYKKALFKMLETAEPRAAEYGLALAKGNRKKRRMSLRMMFENHYQEEFKRMVRGIE